MSAEKTGSKADTLVKVVLVFFISLLSFSVGTFVGKQVSDSDHRRLALEGEYKTERGIASTDSKGEAEAGEKISDKEVESLTEEFVNKEKAAGNEDVAATEGEGKSAAHAEGKSVALAEAKPAAHAEEKADASGYKTFNRGTKMAEGKGEASPKSEPANPENPKSEAKSKVKAKAQPAKVADATEGIAEKVAKGEAPSDGKGEERKPSSVLPSVASSAIGKYTVQVGAYAEETEAKTRAADLKGKGWNSFYIAADVEGRTWYRVSVGLFNNMKSANEFRAQFMKDANTQTAMVRKIVE